MKKLLITASTFPRWEGDSEPRFILDYAKAMQKYYDVTVLVPMAPQAQKREVLEGVPVIRYHYFPIHRFETLCYPGAITARIKQKKGRVLLVPFLFFSAFVHELIILPKFDLVHSHWVIPQGIIQSFLNRPYVVTGHGGDVTSLNSGAFRWLKRRCYNRARTVTVVSEHLKNEVNRVCKEVDPFVISMGVDLEKFGRTYRIENYFNQNDKKVVLYVGRLAEKKGVKYLIQAMHNVNNAILVIVGDGTLRSELEKLSAPISEKVRFLGAKNHDELKTIYASADVFCMPSITANDGDQEGFGLVMLEAMASGLCVVASDSGGISQVIKNECNGLLVEEKNSNSISQAINRIISDTHLCERLVINGYSSIQEYDYKNIGRKYSELFASII